MQKLVELDLFSISEQSQPWKTYVPLIVVAFVIGIVILAVFLLHRSGHLSNLMGKWYVLMEQCVGLDLHSIWNLH